MATATALQDWSAIDAMRSSLATPRLRINQAEGDEIKYVEYDFDDRKRFPHPPSQVELIHLTDLQVGSKNFMRSKFIRYRTWMLASPNRFGILGGDIANCNTVLSKGSPYDDTAEPRYQGKEAVELLKPLADAGRLLGYVGGNHERRTVTTYGDLGADIAERLKVPYSRGVQLIDIRFGKHQPFRISVWHGGGSARTKGAKAQMLHRFMGQHGSQLYLVGHLHDAIILPDWRIERVDGKIRLQKVMGIMSSSFQGYWNSYAECAAMTPSDTMMGRVILDRDGKWETTLRNILVPFAVGALTFLELARWSVSLFA